MNPKEPRVGIAAAAALVLLALLVLFTDVTPSLFLRHPRVRDVPAVEFDREGLESGRRYARYELTERDTDWGVVARRFGVDSSRLALKNQDVELLPGNRIEIPVSPELGESGPSGDED